MDITLKSRPKPGGTVSAPVSKSEAHRALICAALSDSPSLVRFSGTNDDIEATKGALCALGAKIVEANDGLEVSPIAIPERGRIIDCRESGSTLRFMLPVAAALGADCSFDGSGRLPERPLSPLYELMTANGVILGEKGKMPLSCSGRLRGGSFDIDGSVSSQFITGLLLASPLIGDGVTVNVTGRLESRPYIDITLSVMRRFGITVIQNGNSYTVSGSYRSPGEITVGGDWSSAAFWLSAGVLSDKPVSVTGLDIRSAQGDRKIVECLSALGGMIEVSEDKVTAFPSKLTGRRLDCADIPDLVPVLSVAAAFAGGETVFDNVARLRSKESDRILSVISMLEGFGIYATAGENTLTVRGGSPRGDSVHSFSDHRIAMSGAILALCSGCDCTVKGAECVSKSYPGFPDDLESLAHAD